MRYVVCGIKYNISVKVARTLTGGQQKCGTRDSLSLSLSLSLYSRVLPDKRERSLSLSIQLNEDTQTLLSLA